LAGVDADLMMSPIGTSRHFAALQRTVAFGCKADVGWKLGRVLINSSGVDHDVDVRYTPGSGRRADIAAGREGPKGGGSLDSN
jgi:hypothetical protein